MTRLLNSFQPMFVVLFAVALVMFVGNVNAQEIVIYNEDFEAGDGSFTHNGVNDEWEYGTPDIYRLNSGHNFSDYCWGIDLDDSYDSDSVQELVSPTIDLTAQGEAALTFWHIAETEWYYDRCYVEVSVDGTTWTALGADEYEGRSRDFALTEYFHEGSYRRWLVKNPKNNAWKKETFSLNAFVGNAVQIRFSFASDFCVESAGWYIDDIQVLGDDIGGFDIDENLADGAELDIDGRVGDVVDITIPANTYGGSASLYGALVEGAPEEPLPAGDDVANFWWDLHSDGNENWSGTMILHYDEGNLNGIEERSLSARHWNGTEWEDFGGVVDTVANTITIVVSRDEFSPYTVGRVDYGYDSDSDLSDGAALDVDGQFTSNDLLELNIPSGVYTGSAYIYAGIINGDHPDALDDAAGFWWDLHTDGNENWSGTMILHYKEDMLNGISEDSLALNHYDGADWEEVSATFDTEANTLSISVDRDDFSPYAMSRRNTGVNKVGGKGGQSDIMSVVPVAPVTLSNYPNPFNPRTIIAFNLPEATHVNLSLYDITGKLVQTFISNEARLEGDYSVVWDGTDANGRQVASGVYIYRLNTDSSTLVRQMTLLK